MELDLRRHHFVINAREGESPEDFIERVEREMLEPDETTVTPVLYRILNNLDNVQRVRVAARETKPAIVIFELEWLDRHGYRADESHFGPFNAVRNQIGSLGTNLEEPGNWHGSTPRAIRLMKKAKRKLGTWERGELID